jgi:hypothetical protein
MNGSAAAGLKTHPNEHGIRPVPWPEYYHLKQQFVIK